jgi:hypothetical protein
MIGGIMVAMEILRKMWRFQWNDGKVSLVMSPSNWMGRNFGCLQPASKR